MRSVKLRHLHLLSLAFAFAATAITLGGCAEGIQTSPLDASERYPSGPDLYNPTAAELEYY